MKVIKRDGRIQSFDIGKIARTLEYASDEAGEPLTASDVEFLLRAIESAIKGREEDRINVTEIQDIILDQLYKSGFSHVAEHYKEYKKE